MGDKPPSADDDPPPPPLTLVQPSSSSAAGKKKRHRPVKALRVFRSVLRSFPIITPAAGIHILDVRSASTNSGGGGGDRATGTLFGPRKGPVSLSVQESPGTLPMVVVELSAMQTQSLHKELSEGMVRIALECDKDKEKKKKKKKMKLLDEPVWSVFVNGKKNGYGVRREATEEDLHLMEVLKAVSMGAGVIPPPGELSYVRGEFERVVGSKDSETLYMLSPDEEAGPDLSIFFVRI